MNPHNAIQPPQSQQTELAEVLADFECRQFLEFRNGASSNNIGVVAGNVVRRKSRIPPSQRTGIAAQLIPPVSEKTRLLMTPSQRRSEDGFRRDWKNHCHSTRKDSMGSNLEARVAGSHTAKSTTALNATGTITNIIGSYGLTPKRKLAIRRVSAKAAQTPTIVPIIAKLHCPATSQACECYRDQRRAPSAHGPDAWATEDRP
jgi:hypothetical protein